MIADDTSITPECLGCGEPIETTLEQLDGKLECSECGTLIHWRGYPHYAHWKQARAAAKRRRDEARKAAAAEVAAQQREAADAAAARQREAWLKRNAARSAEEQRRDAQRSERNRELESRVADFRDEDAVLIMRIERLSETEHFARIARRFMWRSSGVLALTIVAAAFVTAICSILFSLAVGGCASLFFVTARRSPY